MLRIIFLEIIFSTSTNLVNVKNQYQYQYILFSGKIVFSDPSGRKFES